MILGGSIALGVVAAYLAAALYPVFRLGLGYRQALLYLPFKLFYRIDDSVIAEADATPAPVVYVVWHQSRIDAALMLSLLPEETLHILDERDATSIWLEPWRELARTIAFNAHHVFVSRRLVRVLKGKGRLAVYVPDEVEPDTKSYRLFRAIARIAEQADARIVPVIVDGGRYMPSSLTAAGKAPRNRFARLSIRTLPAMTVAELMQRAGGPAVSTRAGALFDRMAEVRFDGPAIGRSLFSAVRDAALLFGPSRIIVEDILSAPLTYRGLLTGARVLGDRLAAQTTPGEAVGVLLPNASGVVLTLLGLTSGARVPAMLNYTAGPANITSAVRTAVIRTVVSSRAFVEKAGLEDIIAAAEAGGAKIVWLEDIRSRLSFGDKLWGALWWRRAIARAKPDDPAVILFTSGSEGTPKAVVLSHRNVVANAMQAWTRFSISPQDKLFNVLPVFHSFGLTGGTVLPLIAGVRLFLYPSPLHYKQIPEVARKARPTVMFGTDTFLAAYARTAKDDDFSSLRFAVAGAEAVRAETRKVWRERFGAEILEGYGLTEAAPVVAVNTSTHGRDGTVGRLLPGLRMRLEPVEGIPEGGRLWLAGPNVMLGYMTADRPGELQRTKDEWHDSGDIVSVDREGFVTIRGRIKRFAKVAGEMVSLGAVEVLAQSLWPAQHHAAVSVPDKRRGERIVLVTTAEEADAEALRDHARQAGVQALMIPEHIVKVSELPLLGSGKIDYVSARRLAVERLGLDLAA